MVHRSLLRWLPSPSVTQVPLDDRWQYCAPDTTDHHADVPPTGAGGDGDGGGGYDGDGGSSGGVAAGVAEAHATKPPYVTDQSARHDMLSPAPIATFDGPLDEPW